MALRSVILSSGALLLAILGCGGSDEPNETRNGNAGLTACKYEGDGPSLGNAVRIGGGATCDEAAILFKGGPAFGDLKPHTFAERVERPQLGGNWVCEARQPEGEGTALHVQCEDGAKTVEYIFY